MLRINKQTDYGIVLLAHVASAASSVYDSPLTARNLAESTGLPAAMVSKTLKLLCREGFLESQRGVRGGYQLSRPPAAICIADVIQAIEGPMSVTECGSGTNCTCSIERDCTVKVNWQRLNGAIHATLAGITLADMLDSTPDTSAPAEEAFEVWPPPHSSTSENKTH